MIEPIQIVTSEALTMAKIYAKVPTSMIRSEMGKLIAELSDAICAQGIRVTGPWFTHHFRRPDQFFDFEVCMPVESAVRASGRLQPGEWPALTMVRTIYHGDYAALPDAWGEFMARIDAEGLRIGAEIWERYLVNPNDTKDPAEWRTELNRPLVP